MFENELLDFIAAAAGPQVAAQVQEHFGGISLYIPKPKPVDETQQFIEKNFGLMDTRQIARATGLTVRAIQRRLNRPMTNARREQKTLF